MRLLHTSDWHLGHHLISKDRRREHRLFLDWLVNTIREYQVDNLVVAGDIFNGSTPPNHALTLYYDFLKKVSQTDCGHILILGGNHDSVATLHAPRQLLKLFKVHVIGGISKNPDDDIIVVRDKNNQEKGIICGIPFLRDRDVRQYVPGESYQEKSKALLNGVKNHYKAMRDRAIALRAKFSTDENWVPIIATGHLFTAGGQISEGVREIYVGDLGQIHAAYFPSEFDYIALGHLHKAQKGGGLDHIRYSGSPIPLSFSEAGTQKKVLLIEFVPKLRKVKIEEIIIPEFQKLRRLRGDLTQVEESLKRMEIKDEKSPVWVEIKLDNKKWVPDIQNRLGKMVAERPIEILAIKNMNTQIPGLLKKSEEIQTLKELNPQDVFNRRLSETKGLSDADKEELIHAFNEIINQIETDGVYGAG